MLVLNDPAAQLNADGKATAPTGPVTNLSAFASSNDIVVKVCVFAVVCVAHVSTFFCVMLVLKLRVLFCLYLLVCSGHKHAVSPVVGRSNIVVTNEMCAPIPHQPRV